MRLSSVRLRLTLWNIGALALALLGFAAAVHVTVQATLIHTIDDDLAGEARSPKTVLASLLPRSVMVRSVRLGPGAGPEGKPAESTKVFIYKAAPLPYPPTPANTWKLAWPGITLAQDPAKFKALVATFPAGKREHLLDDAKRDPTALHLYRNLDGQISAEVVRGKEGVPPAKKPERPRVVLLGLYDLGGHSLLPPEPDVESPKDAPWSRAMFARAAQGVSQYETVVVNGEPMRILSRPIFDENGRIIGVAQAAYSLSELQHLLHGLDLTLLGLIPLALLAAGGVGAFLTGRALRPVRQIAQAASALEATDLSRRLPATGGDEFAELAATFNGTFARLQAAFARLEESVERQRRFTADASHELRTPLTTIKAHANWALRRERSGAEYQEALAATERAADRMNRLVEDLLTLARTDSGQSGIQRRPVPLAGLVECAVAAVARPDAGPGLRWDTADPLLMINGDPHALERVLVNLLDNALRHTPPEGQVVLSARGEGEWVCLSVRDTGEGIPAEHLPHVCERFYRVDAARTRVRGGSGLGLAICHEIVAAHGGTLDIESVVGSGTNVTVRLPRAQPEASPSSAT